MGGWTESEYTNKDLMSPCGLYCGTCGVYIATRDGNEKFKAVLANLYGTKPEETQCLGCMQNENSSVLYSHCKLCPIRNCISQKGHYSCHQCDEWPCEKVENFEYSTGIQVMKRAIPLWREKVALYGDEKGSIAWARAECDRYHCISCGESLFRGAQRCRGCNRKVAEELDGSL